jgi:hypothetical protein
MLMVVLSVPLGAGSSMEGDGWNQIFEWNHLHLSPSQLNQVAGHLPFAFIVHAFEVYFFFWRDRYIT